MEFKAEHTVSKIIKYLLIAMVAVLILLWFLGGGIGKIVEKARTFEFGSITEALSPTNAFANFRLPWQIDMPAIEVKGVNDYGATDGGSYTFSGDTDAPGGGGASAYIGKITIAQGAARTQSTTGQYIELHSSADQKVSISGWSLEGVVSEKRVLIPQAAPLFVMGSLNTVGAIVLAPGERAILSTGPSPVGVSFQENICTGYLGTYQPFVPPLSSRCPAPLTVIPHTAENEARLGASCFQYLSTLMTCTFPQNPPSTLSPACRSEIQNKLSYNGCVNQNKNSSGFATGSWRTYLAHGAPLWGVEHDIIRLLDDEGRVVNVLNY